MKTRHSARCARSLSLISILLVLVAFGLSPSGYSAIERKEPLAPTCPPPFKPQLGICVIRQNQTISTTIEPTSNTTLDCQNSVLSAATPGTRVDGWPGSRSNPEVAIFLNDVQNVVIQNCTIQGFDFGIIAINSKRELLPQRAKKGRAAKTISFVPNKILKNNITARFTPISLMSVDETEIKNNALTYLTMGGRGLYVGRNSDGNVIQSNKIIADFSSGQKGAVMVPGPLATAPTASLSSNPQSDAGPAVLVTQMLGAEPTLLNMIIGGPTGALYQLGRPAAAFPADISSGNVIDDNDINYPGPPAGASPVPTPTPGNDGIVTSATAQSNVTNNRIWNAAAGIRSGIQIGTGGIKQFPGTCSLDETRLCLQDSDCAITGFDTQSKGTCTLPATENLFWLASDNTIDNNEIHGPFGAGIVVAGQSTVIQNNKIDGNLPSGWKGTGISLLGRYALETTTITTNRIEKVDIGISLQKTFEESASSFGAQVFKNTITAYNIPVQTNGRPANRYDVKSELSVNGEGNYWGLPVCPPGLDPTKVKDVTNPPNSLNCDSMTGCSVTDSHCLGTAPVRVQPPSSRSSRKRQPNRIASRNKRTKR